MAAFTQYWSNATFDLLQNEDLEGELFVYTAGSGFAAGGIGPSDLLFAVSVIRGRLYVAGAMEVGPILDRGEAALRLDVVPSLLYPAPEHLLACRATPLTFETAMPEDLVRELRIVSGRGDRRVLKETRGNYVGLDRQALRGVRRLDECSSRALLDRLGQLEDVSYPKEAVRGVEQEEAL